MNTSVARLPAIPGTTMPTRPAGSSATGFFEHHGAWAPGVRLFRLLSFRSKAWIICAVLTLPVMLLAWNFLNDKGAAIEFSAKERDGVAYLREAVPLVRLGQAYRLRALLANGAATSELGEARKALEAQMVKVDAAEQKMGADLGTAKALAAVKAAALAAASAPADSVLDAHTAHIDTMMALITQATDGSNLTLDPDLDSYYLMDGSLGALPVLVESAARLRGTASALAASGKPAGESQQRLITSSAVAVELFEARVGAALDKVYGAHPDYKASFNSDGLLPQLRAFRELAVSGKADAATIIARGNAVVDGMSALQGEMIDKLDLLLQARIDGMTRHRNLTMLAVAISLLVGAYLFYSFYLVTQGGLNEVQRHLLAMTDGDLTTSPNPWGSDEAAVLMLSLRDMQASLRNIVSSVRGSSELIVHSSTEIASASMDLSARTEETASNLEKSAASMEEISSTVKHTADSVQQAAQVASGNSLCAARGGAVIKEVVSTMQDINASSKKISDIIGTIDGIAFQTNILALNAAVEAARAGEQGRGFAVVASEVRSLAQRSAQAAREIKTLITSSVEKVESGARAVKGAGDTMHELVSTAERMNGLLSEISTASSEQSSGVAQVGASVHQLDQMTQQNAALVEQTAAAASSLRDQALNLATEVARFRLPADR